MPNIHLISLLVFIALALIWLIKDWKNIERKAVVFMRRTQRGRDFIHKVAGRLPRFWAFVGDLGILTGLGGMGVSLYMVVKQAINITSLGPGLSFIVPVATESEIQGNGYTGVPFLFFFISLIVLIFTHEFMHGLQARLGNVRIKSLGVGLFLIIPGAFVEPDENQLKRKSLRTRLRVYAAGSMGNFIIGGLAFLLINLLVLTSFTEGAVHYGGYVDESVYNKTFPAEMGNMTGAIISVDGIRVYSVDGFLGEMQAKSPGDSVNIITTKGEYDLATVPDPRDPERAFIGISQVSDAKVFKWSYRNDSAAQGLKFSYDMLFWLLVLNLGIGLFNLLPIKPLDGGHMFNDISKRLFPKKYDMVIRTTTTFIAVILIYTIGFIVRGFF